MSQSSILLVEDHPDLRTALQEFLELDGHVVHTAEHGGIAVDMVEAGLKPDLVITDLMMPVFDGYHVINKLHNRFPIVVISASVHRTTLAGIKNVVGYLPKPFDIHALSELVFSTLSKSAHPA